MLQVVFCVTFLRGIHLRLVRVVYLVRPTQFVDVPVEECVPPPLPLRNKCFLTYTYIDIFGWDHFVFKLVVPNYNLCIYFPLLLCVLVTVVGAQYTDLPWTFQGGRYGGSSGHKTENMSVDHIVDALFGEWHTKFTLKPIM